MTEKVFTRLASEADLRPKFHHWTGNDASGRHHNGPVPRAETSLDMFLEWKASKNSVVRPVGYFRFNMTALLANGYIRVDRKPGHLRLRFVHSDGRIYIQQAGPDMKRLAIATLGED